MQGVWQRPIAKVDNRTPPDLAQCIDAQSRAAVSIEEAQAKLAFMCINTTFADARDRMLSHECGHITWKHIQELAQKGGIDQDHLIVDFDLHADALRKDRHGFEIARWRSPDWLRSSSKISPFFVVINKDVFIIYLITFLDGWQWLAAYLRYTLADLILSPDDFGIWPAAQSLLRNANSLTNLQIAHSPSTKNFPLAVNLDTH